MRYHIKPSTLTGCIHVPPSKSHTLRAILFASLATGTSTIRQYLPSPDTIAMLNACQLIGAKINMQHNELLITGTAGKPSFSAAVATPIPEQLDLKKSMKRHLASNPIIIDAGNSGQVLRFMAAIAAFTAKEVILTGDDSIVQRRPMQPLLSGLTQLGAQAISIKGNGLAPVKIKGPIKAGTIKIKGEDSQPVSALLIAAAHLQGRTHIEVNHPGETPWVNLTLDWFKRLGIVYEQQHYKHYMIEGDACYLGFDYTVPGDFSSAAFPIAAALITHSELTLACLDMQDAQGDKILINVLQTMGADIQVDEKNRLVHIKKSPQLFGREINANHFIDAVPILAVLGCVAKGVTRITGAAIARAKESNRLAVMVQELQKMGADICEESDGLFIRSSALQGAQVLSHQDHRVALALTVAGLHAKGETIIEDVGCVAKSYPHFARDMQAIGANLVLQT